MLQTKKQPNPYSNIKLSSSIDYKFLATQVGEKLKNENFKPEWRVLFLKTLFEQLKPLLSQTGIERIEKTAQDLFYQKQNEEKAPEKKAAEEAAKKPKKEAKKGVRLEGKKNRFGVEDDDAPLDDEDDFDKDYDDEL